MNVKGLVLAAAACVTMLPHLVRAQTTDAPPAPVPADRPVFTNWVSDADTHLAFLKGKFCGPVRPSPHNDSLKHLDVMGLWVYKTPLGMTRRIVVSLGYLQGAMKDHAAKLGASIGTPTEQLASVTKGLKSGRLLKADLPTEAEASKMEECRAPDVSFLPPRAYFHAHV